MKTLILPTFIFAMLFSLTQCNNPTPEKICEKADSRGKIISALMNNDTYMNEVMDSMRTKHPDVILSTVFVIAKSDKQMQENMMDNMTAMCKMDSSMCKMMKNKTMDMCEDEESNCCKVGSKMTGKKMEMSADCCKKGKMAMGKKGKMTDADKAKCCKMGSK